VDIDVKKVFEKEPKCLSCSALLKKRSTLTGQLYKYCCTNKKCRKVYRVEKDNEGLHYVLPHIRRKFKYKKLKDVPEKKLKKIITCLKTPFGERNGDDSYKLTEDLELKIYKDGRKQPRLFDVVSLRRNKTRKNTIKLLELFIRKVNKKHRYWKYAKSPRVWYNIYCSEKGFIKALSSEDKKKLIKILTTIKGKYWAAMKNNLKQGVPTYKGTLYSRFYNYRSINAFFGNKNVPNFQKLVNEPKPQNVNRIKK